MKAVVMECRVRACGSESRLRKFVDHATSIALNAFAEPVQCSFAFEECESVLLRRQWYRENDREVFGEPVTREVCFAFADSSGRLTAARLESLSRDILSDLELDPWDAENEESVPWILTLSTDVDRASRDDIAARHPMLGLRSAPLFATT